MVLAWYILVWYRYGIGMVLARCWYGIIMLWECYRYCIGVVLDWYGLVLVLEWLGLAMVFVWYRHGSGMVLLWYWNSVSIAIVFLWYYSGMLML